MRRIFTALVLLGLIGLGIFYVLTIPGSVPASALPQHVADVKNGEEVFNVGGCASCHATPVSDKCTDPKSKDKHVLAGGRCLVTPFGTFYPPNITPDKTNGIGGWSDAEFVTAMTKGVSPGGDHYYPAFPFTSYQKMKTEDILDLRAFMLTLPVVATPSHPHELALPFKLRRGIGLWKLLFLDGKKFTPDAAQSEILNRGQYLVEGAGHCAECHSPRNLAGGIEGSLRYAGGPDAENIGWVPNISQAKDGIGSWSQKDIEAMFADGSKPNGDYVGGSMVSVQENIAKISKEDRSAMAAYLKTLPAVSNPRPKKN